MRVPRSEREKDDDERGCCIEEGGGVVLRDVGTADTCTPCA